MKMGKYVVRKGRFVHVSDEGRFPTRNEFLAIVASILATWFFILVGIGVIPFWPFL